MANDLIKTPTSTDVAESAQEELGGRADAAGLQRPLQRQRENRQGDARPRQELLQGPRGGGDHDSPAAGHQERRQTGTEHYLTVLSTYFKTYWPSRTSANRYRALFNSALNIF